jgi:hypothetical protein
MMWCHVAFARKYQNCRGTSCLHLEGIVFLQNIGTCLPDKMLSQHHHSWYVCPTRGVYMCVHMCMCVLHMHVCTHQYHCLGYNYIQYDLSLLNTDRRPTVSNKSILKEFPVSYIDSHSCHTTVPTYGIWFLIMYYLINAKNHEQLIVFMGHQ